MAFLKEIEVPDIQVVSSEKEIGRDWETQYRNWATPKGALALLVALQSQRKLSRESQALLLKLTRGMGQLQNRAVPSGD